MCCTSATGSSHEVTGTEELSDVGQLDVAARQRLGQGVGVSEGGVRECGQRHRGMARWKKSHQASRGHTRPQRVAKSFPSWNAYTNPGGVTGGRPSNWEGFAQTSASRNEESLGGARDDRLPPPAVAESRLLQFWSDSQMAAIPESAPMIQGTHRQKQSRGLNAEPRGKRPFR